MTSFTISKNNFLKQDIEAFYRDQYNDSGYLLDFKNTYGKPEKTDTESYRKKILQDLDNASSTLKKILKKDLPKILKNSSHNSLTVCVVPRAKAQKEYNENQLKFKSRVSMLVNSLDYFDNGTDYIIRHSNTKTTHFKEETPPNYNNDFPEPSEGITLKTCNISSDVKDKNILLIDDIYTHGVNIDEDAIQALLDEGANSVIFYAPARAS